MWSSLKGILLQSDSISSLTPTFVMRNGVIGREADLALRGREKRTEEDKMGQNGMGQDNQTLMENQYFIYR